MSDLEPIRRTAEEAVRAAGRLIRATWQDPRAVSHKGYRDLVTDTDLAAQRRIKEVIAARFPDHVFLAEEDAPAAPEELPTDRPIWIIDPVDGTSNYSRQVPIFAVNLAVVVAGRLEIGITYDPLRDEFFQALAGGGATCNGAPIAVRDQPDLGRAIVALDWGHAEEKRRRSLNALMRFAQHVHTIRALGSAALAFAWIAAGRLDAYVNYDLKAWDVAPAALLLTESGGRLEQADGRPWHWQMLSSSCLATNGRIHDELLSLLKE